MNELINIYKITETRFRHRISKIFLSSHNKHGRLLVTDGISVV